MSELNFTQTFVEDVVYYVRMYETSERFREIGVYEFQENLLDSYRNGVYSADQVQWFFDEIGWVGELPELD